MIRCALALIRRPLMSTPRALQPVDLAGQDLRVDDDAVADDAALARVAGSR